MEGIVNPLETSSKEKENQGVKSGGMFNRKFSEKGGWSTALTVRPNFRTRPPRREQNPKSFDRATQNVGGVGLSDAFSVRHLDL